MQSKHVAGLPDKAFRLSREHEDDEVRSKAIRVAMDRYARAMGWNRDKYLPAIAAYAKEHAEFDDELFAPAFIMKSIAPEDARTSEILGAISDDVRTLGFGDGDCAN